MGLLEAGIPAAARELGRSDEHLLSAATAIMTTDTVPKLFSVDVELSAGSIRVSGVCKGAAMIAPNMATMLGLVMTDARLTADQCSQMLRRAVDQTFNCISVDGHMSTSDTVLMLAGGAAGFDPAVADLELISRAVTEVCRLLATSIIRDAEGADHFITIDVRGLASRADAFRMAKEIANSPLVKTAITGGDFDPAWLSLQINGTEVYRAGTPVPFDNAALSRSIKSNRDVHLELTLAGGPSSGHQAARFWTSDLTAEYVRLNSEYTT